MIPAANPRSHAPLLARLLAVAMAGALLGGCSSFGGVGDTGALFTGRDRLPPLRTAPPVGKPTVQFLPFTGLPVTTADEIFKRLRDKAGAEGLELVNRLEDPATYRIQGHYVALGQDTSSIILYTFDIFDASGARVHHMVGQEIAGRGDGDAWSGVDSAVADRLAARALWAIKVWVTRAER